MITMTEWLMLIANHEIWVYFLSKILEAKIINVMIIWFKIEIDQKKNAATAGGPITYINPYPKLWVEFSLHQYLFSKQSLLAFFITQNKVVTRS